MGIDTVKLISPTITDTCAEVVEFISVTKTGIEKCSGDLLYEFTTGELDGSYDSRIRLVCCRERTQVINGRPVLVPSPPYLEFEASWPKMIYGQNVYGVVDHFQHAAQHVVEILEALILEKFWLHDPDPDLQLPNLNLPPVDLWEVRRVDWAENFALPPEAVYDFFRQFKHVSFPRRKQPTIYEDAIHCAGSSTTLRLYYKGTEFKKHSSSLLSSLNAYWQAKFPTQAQLQRSCGSIELLPTFDTQKGARIAARSFKALQRLANNRLRSECQINAPKLRYDFEKKLTGTGRIYPTVNEVTDQYLKDTHTAQIGKLISEGKSAMETVRNNDEVFARLLSKHSKRKARNLYAFWVSMSGNGEQKTKESFGASGRSQFYAFKSQLLEDGISWHQTNIYILPPQSRLPVDFAPLIGNSRQCFTRVRHDSKFNISPLDYYRTVNDHVYKLRRDSLAEPLAA